MGAAASQDPDETWIGGSESVQNAGIGREKWPFQIQQRVVGPTECGQSGTKRGGFEQCRTS